MLSRISISVRPRFKPILVTLGGQNLDLSTWIHSGPLCSKKSSSGLINRDWTNRHLQTVVARFLATTCTDKLELDPKSNDESNPDGTITSNFSEDGNEIMPEDFGLHLNDENLQEVTGGNPELIKKVNYVQLEYSLYRQEGVLVPSKINLQRWKEILDLNSQSQRKRFYEFLFKIEMKQASYKRKKKELQELRFEQLGEKVQVDNQYGTTYGLGMNTIFHRLRDTTMAKYYHNKVFQAMKFGRPLIYDLGYDDYMTHREAVNCAKQLEISITENKHHLQPFDLKLCNAHKDMKVMQRLLKIIPTLYDDDYFIDITEKSYLDLYPRESIVYLSPHAKDYIDEFNEDDVYIVGAMVDKSDPRPLSLAKAKKEKLRIRKLPLDKYLDWGLGGKSLTLNQMNNIMLEIRYTKDWLKALQFVPTRKLRREEQPDETGSYQRREKSSTVYDDFNLLNKKSERGFQYKSKMSDRNKMDFRNSKYNNGGRKDSNRMRSILSDD